MPQTLPLLSTVNFVVKSFQDFTLNYDIKKTQDGFFFRTKIADLTGIMNEVNVMNLKEELRSCQQIFVDSVLERARHKVLVYADENLIETIVNEKLDLLLNNLKSAA